MILICADAKDGTLSRYESDNAAPCARLTHRFESPMPAAFNWAIVNEMRYAPLMKHRVAGEESALDGPTLELIDRIRRFRDALLDPTAPD